MRPRCAGVLMSASTIMPAAWTQPAPTPATKRAITNSGKLPASAHHRLPSVQIRPPIAMDWRRPSRSARRPAGSADSMRARPYTAIVVPIAEAGTPKACAYSGSTGISAPKPS